MRKSEKVVASKHVVLDETLYPLAAKITQNEELNYGVNDQDDLNTASYHGKEEPVISWREVITPDQQIVPRQERPQNSINKKHNEPHVAREDSQVAQENDIFSLEMDLNSNEPTDDNDDLSERRYPQRLRSITDWFTTNSVR